MGRVFVTTDRICSATLASSGTGNMLKNNSKYVTVTTVAISATLCARAMKVRFRKTWQSSQVTHITNPPSVNATTAFLASHRSIPKTQPPIFVYRSVANTAQYIRVLEEDYRQPSQTNL